MRNQGLFWLLEFQEKMWKEVVQFGHIGWFHTPCRAFPYLSSSPLHQKHALPLIKPFSHIYTNKHSHAVHFHTPFPACANNSRLFTASLQPFHMHLQLNKQQACLYSLVPCIAREEVTTSHHHSHFSSPFSPIYRNHSFTADPPSFTSHLENQDGRLLLRDFRLQFFFKGFFILILCSLMLYISMSNLL